MLNDKALLCLHVHVCHVQRKKLNGGETVLQNKTKRSLSHNTATTLSFISLPPLLLHRHHHHHLPFHYHFVLDRARHSDEGKRHFDLADLGFSQHLLSDIKRCGEADLLVQEDTAAARHLGAQNSRNQAIDEDAVYYGCLKGGGAGIDRVQVQWVGIARQFGEQLHVTGGERFGEGGSLTDVEQPAMERRCCDGGEAEPSVTTDFPPYETHHEDYDAPPSLVELQIPTVSCQRQKERRHLTV